MKICYRLYKENDKEVSEKLLSKLVGELSSLNKFRRQRPAKEYGPNYLKTFLDDPNSTIYIAETMRTKKIVGIVTGKIETPKDLELLEYKPFKSGHITDLYVAKEYRRYGIGKKLLRLIEKFFKEADCDLIEIEVLTSNTPAYSLYKDLHFHTYYVNLRKVLK